MKTMTAIINNEKGSVLVMAIMVLALLTIVAFTATRTSNIEVQISGNELLHQKYFFTAEAGIARAMKQLEQPFVIANAPLVRTGSQATWTFALNKSVFSDDPEDCGGGIGCYEFNGINKGVEWLNNMTLNGVNYSVTLWNNDDSAVVGPAVVPGAFNIDTDALIWLRADASGPEAVVRACRSFYRATQLVKASPDTRPRPEPEPVKIITPTTCTK